MYAAKLHSSRLQSPTWQDAKNVKHTCATSKEHTTTTVHRQKVCRLLAAQCQRHNRTGTTQHTTRAEVRLGWRQNSKENATRWWRSPLKSPLSYACRMSAKTELMAVSSGMAEVLHLRQLIEKIQTGMGLTTFNYNHKQTITWLTDSISATGLTSRFGVNRCSRHISLRFWWMQDQRQHAELDIRRVITAESPADIYTKLLPARIIPKNWRQMDFLYCLRRREDSMHYINDDDKKPYIKIHKKHWQPTIYPKTVEQYKNHDEDMLQMVRATTRIEGSYTTTGDQRVCATRTTIWTTGKSTMCTTTTA